MRVTVHFDIGRLSDTVVALMLRGMMESEARDSNPLVKQILEFLLREKLLRESQQPNATELFFDVDNPVEEFADCIEGLAQGIFTFEHLASRAAPADARALRAGAEFLFGIVEAFRRLTQAAGVS
jgi:hypothetical protein